MIVQFYKGMLIAGLVLAGSFLAAEDSGSYGPKPVRAQEAKAQYEANLAASKGKPDLLVLPGLMADRKARTVEVLVENTGLRGEEIAEFLIVGHESSHGYEALLWSYAKPGDVHRALMFIGLNPGPPRNPAMPGLLPDGDLVTLSIRDSAGKSFPIERLILDKETDKTLPEEGFVFAGSMMVPPQTGKGAAQYIADVDDLRSVASIYNEPRAVLDVPRHASQGEVYGHQVVNPELACEGGTLRTVVMTPGRTDGKPEAKRLRWSIDYMAAATGLVCRLTEKEQVLCEGSSIAPVVERLAALYKEGGAPVVELSFGEALPITDIGKASVLIAMMESIGVIRITPPAAGQLYYRAFVPDKEWQEPAGRPSQPWELHLSRSAGKMTGNLVWHEPVWSDDSAAPTFKRREYEAVDGAAVYARLTTDAGARQAAGRPALPAVLLVFVNPGLTYGELMAFIRPALVSHGTVYVFVQ